jgi:uncharacterized membrane protein YuzA (DUF378 family)
MNGLIKTLLVLAIIGAINWGLVGFFEWNLVQAIFAGNGQEEATVIERVIYALVGLAGLATLIALPRLSVPEVRARRRATA